MRAPASGRMRRALGCGIAAVALTTLSAHAAPRAQNTKASIARGPAPVIKACDLIIDPAVDASDPSLDVVSADVATNATTLTWVMRVRH
ncbi:MAG: hypothetical protein ACYDAQ_18935, partial [Mycobacteriales bacterium]